MSPTNWGRVPKNGNCTRSWAGCHDVFRLHPDVIGQDRRGRVPFTHAATVASSMAKMTTRSSVRRSRESSSQANICDTVSTPDRSRVGLLGQVPLKQEGCHARDFPFAYLPLHGAEPSGWSTALRHHRRSKRCPCLVKQGEQPPVVVVPRAAQEASLPPLWQCACSV